MPIQTKPFDPAKAFDAMAENFRHQIGDMAIRARSVTIYRDMERHQQLESFMCGICWRLSQSSPTPPRKRHRKGRV